VVGQRVAGQQRGTLYRATETDWDSTGTFRSTPNGKTGFDRHARPKGQLGRLERWPTAAGSGARPEFTVSEHQPKGESRVQPAPGIYYGELINRLPRCGSPYNHGSAQTQYDSRDNRTRSPRTKARVGGDRSATCSTGWSSSRMSYTRGTDTSVENGRVNGPLERSSYVGRAPGCGARVNQVGTSVGHWATADPYPAVVAPAATAGPHRAGGWWIRWNGLYATLERSYPCGRRREARAPGASCWWVWTGFEAPRAQEQGALPGVGGVG